jgi:hypothetical protein
MDFLELARLEASPPEVLSGEVKVGNGCQATFTEVPHQESTKGSAPKDTKTEEALQALKLDEASQDSTVHADLNATIRHHLSWLERAAFGVRVSQKMFEEDRAESIEAIKKDRSWDETDPKRFERWSCFREPPNYVQLFLMLRRFVVGYHHPSILTATYAALHDLSEADTDDFGSVANLLDYACDEHWDHMGIERQEGEDTWWSLTGDNQTTYLPRHWSFAVHMVWSESFWRPELPMDVHRPMPEDEIVARHSALCEAFGKDRVRLMFGGNDTIPWTKERREAAELYWRSHQTELADS